MTPIDFPTLLNLPVRKKGYKSSEEVAQREREVMRFFNDEKDAKTFAELLRIAEGRGWVRSTLWRYLQRMVKERKLIMEGEGRGVVYRCNLVELMELNHFAYLDKIRDFSSQKGLHSFYEMGAVNCSILGITSGELNPYEQMAAQAIVQNLLHSWVLLYGLRGVISKRLSTREEVIDFYTTLSSISMNSVKYLDVFLNTTKCPGTPR